MLILREVIFNESFEDFFEVLFVVGDVVKPMSKGLGVLAGVHLDLLADLLFLSLNCIEVNHFK